jgi:hypothetical protein
MEAFVATRGILLGLWLCILGLHPGAAHATAPGDSAAQLDEVEVIGWKQMKRELQLAQDRFYAQYNKLNTKKEFAIHCADEIPTGTRVPNRECRVAFLQRASGDMSREFLLGLTRGESRRSVNYPEIQWTARHEEYRENARALLLANPELLDLAVKWRQLQDQYDRTRNGQVRRDDERR